MRSEGSGVPFALPGLTGEHAASLKFAPGDLEAQVARLIDAGAAIKTLHWGRNYLYLARLETAAGPLDVAVKQFRHRALRDRLRRRLHGSKAAKSWRIANALLAAGLATPEPLFCIESRQGDGPAFYVCRHLPDVLEARYLLRAANAGREAELFPDVDLEAFLRALGATVRRLHDAGFWHRDLSSGNVLIERTAEGVMRLHLVDLNRTRLGKRLTLSERARDLSRMALFRPEHQALYLDSYWRGDGEALGGRRLGRALYLAYHRAFLWKNRGKQRLRAGGARLRHLLPRAPHAHIPEAPVGAPARDRVVWDRLSDQPHQHAGGFDKLRVRLGDGAVHAGSALALAGALPRIWTRYRRLTRELHRKEAPFRGLGVGLRPWPEAPEVLLALVDELGPRHALLRLHPWDEDHTAEEELARALHARGIDLTFALPQNRELVRDPERWRRAVEAIALRFTPYGRRFQIGQAINRSKWGVWNAREYAALAHIAAEALRSQGDVELLGPSVIDFEYHITAAVLNLPAAGFHLDAVSALLYVDRRGAPEGRQAGLDTVGKVLLLKAIAETAKNAAGRCYVTEVNWPLREGPHSPAGRAVSVDEETQADYLVRYYLLALGTGALEAVFWWQLVARGYGLVDPAGPSPADLRRRPSFHALKTLIRELGGATLEDVLPVEKPGYLYRFRRPDSCEVVVGWSAGAPVTARLPRPAVSVHTLDGGELPAPAGVEVTLSPSPRYYRLRD